MSDDDDILRIPDPAKRLEALEAAERARRKAAELERIREKTRLRMRALNERSVAENKRALFAAVLEIDTLSVEEMESIVANGQSDLQVAKRTD